MKIEIGAYYYPGWHDKDGFNEWNLLKEAKPYFEGHNQPRVPLEGYINDSKIETVKHQTELAQKHGIDHFIFDWYWKHGERELEEPLKAFLKSDTNMKFSLMWAWKLPKRDLPAYKGYVSKKEDERWIETSTEDFKNILDYCIDNYFNDKRYQYIDDKPVITMYYLGGLINNMGKEAFGEMLHEGKKYMKEKGFKGLFLSGVVTEPIDVFGLELDALTGYNFLADFKSQELIQDYNKLSKERVKEWSKIKEKGKLPYIPSISAGWDTTPRGERVDNIYEQTEFPWAPIITNDTSENFGKFLREGIEFAKKEQYKIVNICAWNEWSEGAYLEPDTKNEFGYLNQIKAIKQELNL